MGRGVRTFVRIAAAVALVVAVFAIQSGGDSDPGGVADDSEPTTSLGRATTTIGGSTTTETTATPGPDLVVNRRSMTAAEIERIDDDDGTGALDCSSYRGVSWEHGPIGDETQAGRQADDALREAISALSEDAGIVLPESGWTELVERKDRSTYVHEEANWQALIVVQGDADLGIWLHTVATVCTG